MNGFIDPMVCPSCNRRGRPGELDFPVVGEGEHTTIHCQCGVQFEVTESRDQFILSRNIACRLTGASNYFEKGQLTLAAGKSAAIKFQQSIDILSKAHFAPNKPMLVREDRVSRDNMTVISSALVNAPVTIEPANVDWAVEGLVGVDALPTWYVLFYGGITLTFKELYKAAFLEYSVAFEAFLGSLLKTLLTERLGQPVAEYILRRTRRIEDRCTTLLKLVTGHGLNEYANLYQSGKHHLQEPRNTIMHEGKTSVRKEDAEQAHQITYQAIRWIQSISGRPEHPLGPLKWKGMAGTYPVPAGSTSVEIKFPKPITSL